MGCIIVLVCQFFLLYSVLFVLQTMNRLRLIDRKREERSWAPVVESVFFVPMLCVLFLAARLQAMQLAGNQPGRHSLPQPWVHVAMLVCTVAVLWAGLAQVGIGLAGLAQEGAEASRGVAILAKHARLSKNAAMALVYVCFTAICLGVCIMQAPADLAGPGTPRVSPAVLCTVLLTVMYFAVYLGLVCVSMANELGLLGQRLRFCQALEYLRSATTTVVFSPMLCVLFLAAQAHAMQLDPGRGEPQGWVHLAFYICSACVVVHTLVVVGGTIVDMRAAQGEGASPSPASPSRFRQRAVQVLSFVLMTGLYGGVITIIVSIYHLGAAPSSLSLHCITGLTVLYFAVNWVHLSIPLAQQAALRGSGPPSFEPSGGEVYVGVLAKEAVAFCPKFCVLFLGTVMRAQQLTNGMGAPQGWCQLMQCVASGCIGLLAVVRVDVLLKENARLTAACIAVQYVCLSLLYASAIATVVALLLLTPENATGWGAIVVGR